MAKFTYPVGEYKVDAIFFKSAENDPLHSIPILHFPYFPITEFSNVSVKNVQIM
jgi:hypothetical protein